MFPKHARQAMTWVYKELTTPVVYCNQNEPRQVAEIAAQVIVCIQTSSKETAAMVENKDRGSCVA